MEENKFEAGKVLRISKKRSIFFAVVLALIVFVAMYLYSPLGAPVPGIDLSMDVYSPSMPSPQYNNESGGYAMPRDYYKDYDQPTINDTREFLKTSYAADIKTRDVSDTVKEVKNIIKGSDGRIDNSYSSDKSGRVSFAVEKSKFDALRDEIEAITHKKLYTESISSENMLGQKQSIEEQISSMQGILDDLNKQKDALTVSHNQAVNAIKNEISRIQSELVAVRANIANTTDNQIILTLRNQESVLVSQESAQRQKLNGDNNSYSIQKQNLESQINSYNDALVNINKQDTKFAENIETVNGYVSVEWINLWQIAKIYSPVSPVIVIIIILLLVWIYLKHIRVLPKIEWY